VHREPICVGILLEEVVGREVHEWLTLVVDREDLEGGVVQGEEDVGRTDGSDLESVQVQDRD